MAPLNPLGTGIDSRTFCFRHARRPYVFRVNSSRAGFDKDAFAYRHFARPALPIPEILSIGSLHDGNFYCLSRRQPGCTLQDLARREIAPLLTPVARTLSAIASTDISTTTGFGPLDSSGRGQFPTWRDFLLSAIPATAPDSPALRYLTSFCPETRRLVHGDFGSNNVLVHRRRITAVLDWSEALIGDPLYDVANLFFWRAWLTCMELQAGYFETRLSHLPFWRERLLCYQLHIALREQAVIR